MNPWTTPWWGWLNGPLSGDVSQQITPFSHWLSPAFEFNFAGNRPIETEVVAQVASYGKQLGILSEAMLELARGKPGEALEELDLLTAQIEQVKEKHKNSLIAKTRADLSQLRLLDRAALERLLDRAAPERLLEDFR